jgi:hypothetical protein
MAQLAANPWTVSSADVLPLTVHKNMVRIHNIEWEGYSNATDTFTITDINGNDVWSQTGATDGSTIRSGDLGNVNGLIVTAMTPASTGLLKFFFK